MNKQKPETNLNEVIKNCLETHPEQVKLISEEELEKELKKPAKFLDMTGKGHNLNEIYDKI